MQELDETRLVERLTRRIAEVSRDAVRKLRSAPRLLAKRASASRARGLSLFDLHGDRAIPQRFDSATSEPPVWSSRMASARNFAVSRTTSL